MQAVGKCFKDTLSFLGCDGAIADIQSNCASVMPDITYEFFLPLGSYFQIWKCVSQGDIFSLCCSFNLAHLKTILVPSATLCHTYWTHRVNPSSEQAMHIAPLDSTGYSSTYSEFPLAANLTG